jgi:hypothetical protein
MSISVAMGRAGPEMTSPFDSLTPNCYTLVNGIFRPSVTVQKLLEFFDYHWKCPWKFKGRDNPPEKALFSMRPPKAPPWFNPRVMRYKNQLSRSTCARDEGKKQKSTKNLQKRIFHLCAERSLADGFQPNLENSGISLRLSIIQNFMLIGEGVQVLQGVDKCMLS